MSKYPLLNTVLIIGSAPDALRVKEPKLEGVSSIVAINNAWQIRKDWDYLIYPDDFLEDRLPKNVSATQKCITSDIYVPAQNHFGGFVYAGGTMSFTAAYWALYALRPDIIAFIGCDMVYPKESATHFYGSGEADPLRDDMTLQSLEAKSSRLQVAALERQCLCVNLSSLETSRLTFPRVATDIFFNSLKLADASFLNDIKKRLMKKLDLDTVRRNIFFAKNKEAELNYFIGDGKYWHHFNKFNSDELNAIDQYWLSASV